MRKVELRVATGSGGSRTIAMTAYLPEPRAASGCVIFASPGGGYGRGYYDMHFPGHDGYSQAAHHAEKGHVLVAYDHLGVGESSVEDLASLTIEDIAAHNHEAVTQVSQHIRKGSLCREFPALPRAAMIGIGQSMGGGVSIIMQGRHRSFDAIGVLGYSAIHTVLPQRTQAEVEQGAAMYDYGRDTDTRTLSVERSSVGVSDFVYPFHWEDVAPDILETDMSGGYPIRRTAPPFGSLTIPNCVVAMMSPGFVAIEAAMIDVPVFLGFGERDTSPDVRGEVAAFPNARDISLFIAPRMAHMHNFASSRRLLWDRLSDWSGMVANAIRSKER
jgi:pimeloyl-ACP methyl ester carboxylesterase